MQTPKVSPKSALGKAITCCRNQWHTFIVFLEDSRLEIDNNRIERSIKPFIISRKNFLFSNTPKDAKSSSIIYSVETAKENDLKTFEYLKYLFEQLPNVDTENNDELVQLLPWSATIPLHSQNFHEYLNAYWYPNQINEKNVEIFNGSILPLIILKLKIFIR